MGASAEDPHSAWSRDHLVVHPVDVQRPQLSLETILLALSCFDRAWSAVHQDLKSSVMDLAAASLWIAAKYNEAFPPHWTSIVKFFGVERADEEQPRIIRSFEIYILKTLQWDIVRYSITSGP
mmetsp:Transcript_13228/g.33544  ORF Transcript_13228/g.33544 Transcript_13228/m.33544 type:complete len:123 (+) Transcript_13228:291-659(+)